VLPAGADGAGASAASAASAAAALDAAAAAAAPAAIPTPAGVTATVDAVAAPLVADGVDSVARPAEASVERSRPREPNAVRSISRRKVSDNNRASNDRGGDCRRRQRPTAEATPGSGGTGGDGGGGDRDAYEHE